MLSRSALSAVLSRPAARLPMPPGWRRVSRVLARFDDGSAVLWRSIDRADAAALFQRGAVLALPPSRPWLAVLDLDPLAPLGACS